MPIRVSKGNNYFYTFPTVEELETITLKFDDIIDAEFGLKNLTDAEYEKEVDIFNTAELELTDFERDSLEMQSLDLSREFSAILKY